ncbi:His/Gly/Thr/Pro-type tRNA ligase C-terminal domain-containing protein, partial [bacterium]|nr:His/Gly/Thr/Pro-type tRNA ligase C-terminal domain-containing protein [bacterium]
LLAAMEQLDLLPNASTPASVLVTFFEKDHRDDYLRLAANLREAGVATEVYPDAKKLGAQLKYAGQRGFQLAVIAGGNEWSSGTVQLKTLATKQSEDLTYSHDHPDDLVKRIAEILAAPVE